MTTCGIAGEGNPSSLMGRNASQARGRDFI
jgi:hypothetical protein